MVTTPNPQSQTPLNPAPQGKNYWVCRKENPLVTWIAKFPARYVEPREFLDFVEAVLVAAEQEEVYRVLYVPSDARVCKRWPRKYWEYRADICGVPYAEFLEQAFNETGDLLSSELWSSPGWLEQYRVLAATRLSYYDRNGQVIEADVEDIGALLQQLRPLEEDMDPDIDPSERPYREEHINSYKAHGAALYFYGGPGSSLTDWTLRKAWEGIPPDKRDRESKPSAYSAGLNIHLYTDIWFPWVSCPLEYVRYGYRHAVPLFDNRELALRHTPRLNRFLNRVKQLIEQRGGSFKYDEDDITECYRPMISHEGIRLDA
jgi:hypothetical protein